MNYTEVSNVADDSVYSFAVNKAGTDIVSLNRPQMTNLIDLYIDLALKTRDEEWFMALSTYKNYVIENKLM